MSKLPIPSGPPGIARRFIATEAKAKLPAQKRQDIAREALKTAEAAVTKAEKVKQWRLANPEAYAEQKRRSAEKRVAKLKAS